MGQFEAWQRLDQLFGKGKTHPVIPEMLPVAVLIVELLQRTFTRRWRLAFAIIVGDMERAGLIIEARDLVEENFVEDLKTKLADAGFVQKIKQQVDQTVANRKAELEAERQQERDDRQTELRKAEERGYQKGMMAAAGIEGIDPAEIDPHFKQPQGDVFEFSLRLGAAIGLAGRRLLDDNEIAALAECRMQRDIAAILARRAKKEPPRKLLAAAIPATLYYRLDASVIAQMLGIGEKWLSGLPELIDQVAHLVGLDGLEFRRRIEVGDPPRGWIDYVDQTAVPAAA